MEEVKEWNPSMIKKMLLYIDYYDSSEVVVYYVFLKELLEEMNELRRMVLLMRYRDDYSVNYIANFFDTDEKMIDNITYRGIKSLVDSFNYY